MASIPRPKTHPPTLETFRRTASPTRHSDGETWHPSPARESSDSEWDEASDIDQRSESGSGSLPLPIPRGNGWPSDYQSPFAPPPGMYQHYSSVHATHVHYHSPPPPLGFSTSIHPAAGPHQLAMSPYEAPTPFHPVPYHALPPPGSAPYQMPPPPALYPYQAQPAPTHWQGPPPTYDQGIQSIPWSHAPLPRLPSHSVPFNDWATPGLSAMPPRFRHNSAPSAPRDGGDTYFNAPRLQTYRRHSSHEVTLGLNQPKHRDNVRAKAERRCARKAEGYARYQARRAAKKAATGVAINIAGDTASLSVNTEEASSPPATEHATGSDPASANSGESSSGGAHAVAKSGSFEDWRQVLNSIQEGTVAGHSTADAPSVGGPTQSPCTPSRALDHMSARDFLSQHRYCAVTDTFLPDARPDLRKIRYGEHPRPQPMRARTHRQRFVPASSPASAEASGSGSYPTTPRTPSNAASSPTSATGNNEGCEPWGHRPRRRKVRKSEVWGFEEFMAIGKDKFGKRGHEDGADRGESPTHL